MTGALLAGLQPRKITYVLRCGHMGHRSESSGPVAEHPQDWYALMLWR